MRIINPEGEATGRLRGKIFEPPRIVDSERNFRIKCRQGCGRKSGRAFFLGRPYDAGVDGNSPTWWHGSTYTQGVPVQRTPEVDGVRNKFQNYDYFKIVV